MTGQKDIESLVWRGGEVRANKQCQHGEEKGLEQTHLAFLINSFWQGLQKRVMLGSGLEERRVHNVNRNQALGG